MILYLILLIASLFFLIKSAEYATLYSSKIAKNFRLSEFIVSFFIVAVVSAAPETTIAIISAFDGVPEFGLGTLLGSNVTDLTLVFGIVALFSLKGISVKSRLLRKDFFYLILLSIPLLLGIDGRFSRVDGIILVISCMFFFFTLANESKMFKKTFNHNGEHVNLGKSIFLLIISLIVLLISAYFAVKFGVNFATELNIPPVLVGLIFAGLGTCLPELIFSIKAVKRSSDGLAMGDILGTVIIDATLIMGITCLIQPFNFDRKIIYITGVAMFVACLVVVRFMKTDKLLTKKEGIYLIFLYIIFLLIELFANRVIS